MLGTWLKKTLGEAGVTQAQLARHLTNALDRTYERQAINKMVAGTRQITAEELLVMTRLLKSQPPLESGTRLRTITVAAHVQAGYWAETWEWSDDERYEVAVPADPILDGFTLYGAETRGPSMNRRWPERTVLVFTNVMETEESPEPGKRYVVQRSRADGLVEHTVKLLHRDTAGKYWLVPESTDPLFQAPISVDQGADDGVEVRIVGRVRYAVTRE